MPSLKEYIDAQIDAMSIEQLRTYAKHLSACATMDARDIEDLEDDIAELEAETDHLTSALEDAERETRDAQADVNSVAVVSLEHELVLMQCAALLQQASQHLSGTCDRMTSPRPIRVSEIEEGLRDLTEICDILRSSRPAYF